jgi:hypothetical protein
MELAKLFKATERRDYTETTWCGFLDEIPLAVM